MTESTHATETYEIIFGFLTQYHYRKTNVGLLLASSLTGEPSSPPYGVDAVFQLIFIDEFARHLTERLESEDHAPLFSADDVWPLIQRIETRWSDACDKTEDAPPVPTSFDYDAVFDQLTQVFDRTPNARRWFGRLIAKVRELAAKRHQPPGRFVHTTEGFDATVRALFSRREFLDRSREETHIHPEDIVKQMIRFSVAEHDGDRETYLREVSAYIPELKVRCERAVLVLSAWCEAEASRIYGPVRALS